MTEKKWQFLGFLVISLCLFGKTLLANSESYTLKVATMDLPPYGWKDEAGRGKGIIFDMTQEMAVRSGLPFTHKVYPFNRMLKLLQAGKIDIISSQTHKKALAAGDKLALQFKIDVIAATGKKSGIEKIEDFSGKEIIYHNGASYSQLENIDKTIEYTNDYGLALSLLHKRPQYSGAVFSEPAYYYFMKKEGLTPQDFGNVIYIERDKEQWMFVRKDLPNDIRKKLKKIVTDIYNEGMYEQMLSKYGK